MKALLVIDVDSGNGWPGEFETYPEEQKAVARALKRTLTQQRTQGLLTIFVTFPNGGYSGQEAQISEKEKDGTLSRFTDSIRALAGDGPYCIGCDNLNGRLAPFLEHRHGDSFEPVFLKSNSSAFSNKCLVEFIRLKNVSELMLAGCFTDMCVLATAKDAVANGFNVVLLEDCVCLRLVTEREKEYWLNAVKLHVPKFCANAVSVSIR